MWAFDIDICAYAKSTKAASKHGSSTEIASMDSTTDTASETDWTVISLDTNTYKIYSWSTKLL